MTNPFRRIYPGTGDGRIFLDGGLNSRFPVSVIPDNESPDCLNITLDDGAAGTREGSSLLNTTAIGTFPIDGLYVRRGNDDGETMVAFCKGSPYALATTTFITIGSGQSVFTNGIRVGSAQYENHIFFGQAGVVPYKWNGTDFTRHGIYPPTTTMTAATSSNGTITGQYRYKLTNVNSQLVESDVGPATATFTATAEEITVSSIPLAPTSYGVSTRKLYRTENAGSAYKLLATISNNTATTYTDNSSDSELTTTAPVDQGVPPQWDVAVYYQDRLFMNDPSNLNYVWYSELGNPYIVKATNFNKAGDNTSDLVRGIIPYSNGILVVGDKSFTLIYMPDTTTSNWVTVVLSSKYGTKSPYALVNFQDRMFFPAMENGKFVGFANLLGTTVEPSGTSLTVQGIASDLNSKVIEDQIADIQTGYLKNISAIIYKSKIYITLSYGTSQTTNNRIYVFDYSYGNLDKSERFTWIPWTGLNISQFAIYQGNLYGGSSASDGKVYQLNNGTYSDNGTAINSYIWTKEFPGFIKEENFHKDFRYVNILIDKPGAYFMDVLVRNDSDSGDGDLYQVSLNPNSSLWGTMIWGANTWGGGADQQDLKLFIGNKRGKRIQFQFNNQNTVNQRFKIHWLKYSYNLKGHR